MRRFSCFSTWLLFLTIGAATVEWNMVVVYLCHVSHYYILQQLLLMKCASGPGLRLPGGDFIKGWSSYSFHYFIIIKPFHFVLRNKFLMF